MPIPASVCPKVASIERISDGMSRPVQPMDTRVRQPTSPAARRARGLIDRGGMQQVSARSRAPSGASGVPCPPAPGGRRTSPAGVGCTCPCGCLQLVIRVRQTGRADAQEGGVVVRAGRGRRAGVELAAVERFVGRAAGGLAALVLEGEAGIGKTTIWTRGVAARRDAGFTVLTVRPARAEQGLTLGALTDLLADVDDARARAAARSAAARARDRPPPGGSRRGTSPTSGRSRWRSPACCAC